VCCREAMQINARSSPFLRDGLHADTSIRSLQSSSTVAALVDPRRTPLPLPRFSRPTGPRSKNHHRAALIKQSAAPALSFLPTHPIRTLPSPLSDAAAHCIRSRLRSAQPPWCSGLRRRTRKCEVIATSTRSIWLHVRYGSSRPQTPTGRLGGCRITPNHTNHAYACTTLSS
jgi:hypothetical protein